MKTNNELIETIDASYLKGNPVKQVRDQKHAPAFFYMTLSDGKQLGPIHTAGTVEECQAKYQAAQKHLAHRKSTPTKPVEKKPVPTKAPRKAA